MPNKCLYSTVGPELTFVPAARPHWITDEKAGKEMVKRLNDYLVELGKQTSVYLFAKLDPLHSLIAPNTDDKITWSLEIVPTNKMPIHWFIDTKQWKLLKEALSKHLFEVIRRYFNMVPFVIETGRRHRYWPNGGCHIHHSADVADESHAWYERMRRFHCNLLTDFANRPYIRWLFSGPFSDNHAETMVNADTLPYAKLGEDGAQFLPGNNSIRARFMSGQKSLYPTFEFRFPSMVADANELRSLVLFIHRWVQHWGANSGLNDPTLLFELDKRGWRRVTSEAGARRGLRELFEQLDLDPRQYTPFVHRNLLPRLRYGELI